MPVFVRKKPVVVAAMHYEGWNADNIIRWVGGEACKGPNESVLIPTKEGTMTADKNDWIICGVEGEFYPCKPAIFEKTYDITDDVEPPKFT